jgi:hypothetical protein
MNPMSEPMSEPKMLIYAQCGRRHYPTGDLAANVSAYRQAFGLPETTRLVGRVHRQFDTARNPIDAGEPIEVALASAAELTAKPAKSPTRPANKPSPCTNLGPGTKSSEEPKS